MTSNKRGSIAFPAAIGMSVGVGSTAIRSFQESLGTPLAYIAGMALSAAVALVAALTVQYFVNRFSKPAE